MAAATSSNWEVEAFRPAWRSAVICLLDELAFTTQHCPGSYIEQLDFIRDSYYLFPLEKTDAAAYRLHPNRQGKRDEIKFEISDDPVTSPRYLFPCLYLYFAEHRREEVSDLEGADIGIFGADLAELELIQTTFITTPPAPDGKRITRIEVVGKGSGKWGRVPEYRLNPVQFDEAQPWTWFYFRVVPEEADYDV